nr:hypothetical protein [Tanacetum cinerariifolium]
MYFGYVFDHLCPFLKVKGIKDCSLRTRRMMVTCRIWEQPKGQGHQWRSCKYAVSSKLSFQRASKEPTICEQDVDLEKKEAHVEDDDDYGNICDIYDITAEDVELIRQFLMPNFPDEMNEVIQPLIPQPIHTTPLNDDYVAPATKSILDELLEEFSNDILNVTMVDKEADFSPTKDIEELKKTSR